MTNPGDEIRLHDVALELGRSLEQVRRYVREGKLPAQKLGMQWFVKRRDLEIFKAGSNTQLQDVLFRARALREKIKERVGVMDVAEMLDQSRGIRH